MKNNKNLTTYISIFNIFFNVIFLVLLFFIVVNKKEVENFIMFILALSVIIIIEKTIFYYWLKTSYLLVIFEEKVCFLYKGKEKIFLRSECNSIIEKEMYYKFNFSNDKVYLRKEISDFSFKSNNKIIASNFPNAKIE